MVAVRPSVPLLEGPPWARRTRPAPTPSTNIEIAWDGILGRDPEPLSAWQQPNSQRLADDGDHARTFTL